MSLLTKKKMNSEHGEMKELASRICRDYLHGSWKDVTPQTIGFKHISGGLSNFLYQISLPEQLQSADKYRGEPKEVLVRVYGQTHGERALEALITESVIFTLLSERGLGPKLHGIFPGGRIEEYINARPLKNAELADEQLSNQIAKKMAAIHCMEVPLHKEPGWLWETIARWLKSSQIKLMRADLPDVAKPLLDLDFAEELEWLKKRVEDENCPVTFCHNDMQEGNILMCQDENENSYGESKLVLIDFEYCSYNYRSFDLANHFVEWVYDYTEPEMPFFKESWQNYPSDKQCMDFINHYLEETCCTDNPQKVLREVKVFTLASHYFWTLWSIVNADSSEIPFGYWEYAVCRLAAYSRGKHELQQQSLNVQAAKRKADVHDP